MRGARPRRYAAQVSDSTDVPATDRSGPGGLARRSAEQVDDSLYAVARADAAELGAVSPDPLTAEAIRLIARLTGARAAVCLTPAPGVPALAILAAAGLEVADKLADGAYDLLVADVPGHSVSRVVSRAQKLLRPGGALVLLGEHAPLPEGSDLPDHAHITMLPVGDGLTVVTL